MRSPLVLPFIGRQSNALPSHRSSLYHHDATRDSSPFLPKEEEGKCNCWRYLLFCGRFISFVTFFALVIVFALASLLNVSLLDLGRRRDTKMWSTGAADTFVTRKDGKLWLGDEEFRFHGMNAYWLGLDENVGGIDWPSHYRIDDVLITAKEALSSVVIRSHTLGISWGTSKSFMPSLGMYNHSNLDSADYALFRARKLGIKFIIPLADRYWYYHGSDLDFVKWRKGEDEGNRELFYTDETIIKDFEDYIQALMNHVNPYTKLRWKDDATIMAWETGNELDCSSQWTVRIARFIKRQAASHLVMDGRFGVHMRSDEDPDDIVDIVGNHYYYSPHMQLLKDYLRLATVHSLPSKVFIVGEYDWRGRKALPFFLWLAKRNPQTAGVIAWSLFPHNDIGGTVVHEDGFTLHYPGDTDHMKRQLHVMVHYAKEVTTPQHLIFKGEEGKPYRPPSPLLLAEQSNASNRVVWRGAATSTHYQLRVASESLASTRMEEWTVLPLETQGTAFPSLETQQKEHQQLLGTILACLNSEGRGMISVRGVGSDGAEGEWSDAASIRVFHDPSTKEMRMAMKSRLEGDATLFNEEADIAGGARRNAEGTEAISPPLTRKSL